MSQWTSSFSLIGPTGPAGSFGLTGTTFGDYIYYDGADWEVGSTLIRLGSGAGQINQGAAAIALGQNAGNNTQSASAIAIGDSAGRTSQGLAALAFGGGAGYASQGNFATAVGNGAGYQTQGVGALAFGNSAGYNNQGTYALAVGNQAGESNQGNYAIAIGYQAGQTSTLGQYAVAIGAYAGQNSVNKTGTIAIGWSAGNSNQGQQGIALGQESGNLNQGNAGTAIGYLAAGVDQGISAVAIGSSAGYSNQGDYAVAIGNTAGTSNQANYAVAIGNEAGVSTQKQYATAVGMQAGNAGQGEYAVALGYGAGFNEQGNYAVAIGYLAGEQLQNSNSIVINASDAALNATNSGLYVKPIREVIPAGQYGIFYDTLTNEVIHNSIITLSTPNTIIIAGNLVPDQSLTYTLGTSSLRYSDAFFGPGSINIAGPSNASATIGTDSQGIIYTQSGFATPFVNIGPAQLTPQAVGGWRIGPTGTQGTVDFDLIVQEIQANGSGPTGPIYSLIHAPTGATGPTGNTGPAGTNGISGGLTFYLDSATTTVTAGNPAIGSLPLTPNLGAQTTITYVTTGAQNVLVAKLTTEVGALSSTVVPPGLWDLNIFAAVNNVGSAPSFYYSIYQVDADGVSNPTLIVSGSNEPVLITNLQSSQTIYDLPLYVPFYTLTNSTKRIQIQLYVNGGATNRTAYFEFRSGAVSHLHTTLAVTSGATGPAGNTGPTGPVGPLKSAIDHGSYLYYDTNGWIVGSTSISLGTDAGLTNQGSNAVAIGYKAGETNQPAGSIILNAGGTGLNGTNPGLYIKPIREVPPNGQEGLFYDTTTHEVVHNSIITLSSQNTIVVGGSIVPDSTLAYSLGTPALRFADAYFGPSTIHIGDDTQSVTIGMNANGTLYTSRGLVVDNLVIGSSESGYYSIVTSNNNLLMHRANDAGTGIGPTMSLNDTSLRSTIVSIGSNAGSTIQNNFAIAVGNSAGRSSQGSNSIAIGYGAGSNSQGQNAIAIGYLAAQSDQKSNSIVLNASGSALNTTQPGGLYINPVRHDILSNQQQQGLFFNTATNEVIRNSVITLSSPNTIVVAGHIVPNTNLAYKLGTSSLRFGDAFFGSNSVYIGNAKLSADSRGTLLAGSIQAPNLTLGSDSLGYWSIGSTISSFNGPAYSLSRLNRRDIGFANTVAENNTGVASFDVYEDLTTYSTMLSAGSTILFSATFAAGVYSSIGLSSISYQFRPSVIRRITSPFTYWSITNSNIVKTGWVFPFFSSITYGLSSFTEYSYKGFNTDWVSSIYHTADDSSVNRFTASSITTNTQRVNGITTMTAAFNPLIFQDSGNADSNSQYIWFKKPTLSGYLGWGGFNNYGVQSQSTFIIETFASTGQIALATNYAWRLVVASNGYVGVGTSAPSYPLTINGSANANSQTGFLFSKSTVISSIGSSTINASVYANNSVWSGTGFFVTSDERIKTNIEDIQDQVALSTIRAIQPKSYNYVDTVTRGSERVYGFLSQQVSSVVQNAVRAGSDVIPNVYSDLNVEISSDESANYIYCSSFNETFIQSLSQDTTAIFYDANNSKIAARVSSITDSTTATFATTDTLVPYVDPSTLTSTLFLYGTQVDDLLILNKEYLFTLNVAATQEIDRTQQSALQRIAALEATVQAQQSTIEYLLSRV